MMRIRKFNEAIETECQTPETIYDINISDRVINVNIDLPMDLNLSEDDAIILEANIHNAMEIILSKYFSK